jgi:glycine betaine/proline transport system ATP-binding protein
MGLSGQRQIHLTSMPKSFYTATSGEIIINGTDISKVSSKELLEIRRKELSMVFQNFGLLHSVQYYKILHLDSNCRAFRKTSVRKYAMDCMQQVD